MKKFKKHMLFIMLASLFLFVIGCGCTRDQNPNDMVENTTTVADETRPVSPTEDIMHSDINPDTDLSVSDNTANDNGLVGDLIEGTGDIVEGAGDAVGDIANGVGDAASEVGDGINDAVEGRRR